MGICLGNNQGNLQLCRFTRRENTAKSSGMGLLFSLTLYLEHTHAHMTIFRAFSIFTWIEWWSHCWSSIYTGLIRCASWCQDTEHWKAVDTFSICRLMMILIMMMMEEDEGKRGRRYICYWYNILWCCHFQTAFAIVCFIHFYYST